MTDPQLSRDKVTVTARDLPLHCPLKNAPLWSQHPRVFLDIEDSDGSSTYSVLQYGQRISPESSMSRNTLGCCDQSGAFFGGQCSGRSRAVTITLGGTAGVAADMDSPLRCAGQA